MIPVCIVQGGVILSNEGSFLRNVIEADQCEIGHLGDDQTFLLGPLPKLHSQLHNQPQHQIRGKVKATGAGKSEAGV